MPEFSADVPHTLGQAVAAEKLNGFVDGVRNRYKDQVSSVEGEWLDPHTLQFGLTSFGITINGRLEVEEEVVKIRGQLPFSALMFKGKIVAAIEEGLKRALA